MGGRRDKVLAVSRLLGAGSGIPGVFSDGVGITMPHPYSAIIHTGMTERGFTESLATLPHKGTALHIHYSRLLHDSPADAVVSMRLGAYLPLLEAHYNAVHAERVAQGKE